MASVDCHFRCGCCCRRCARVVVVFRILLFWWHVDSVCMLCDCGGGCGCGCGFFSDNISTSHCLLYTTAMPPTFAHHEQTRYAFVVLQSGQLCFFLRLLKSDSLGIEHNNFLLTVQFSEVDIDICICVYERGYANSVYVYLLFFCLLKRTLIDLAFCLKTVSARKTKWK